MDWGRDVEESDRAVVEVREFAAAARLKRQDMGDSVDSRSAFDVVNFSAKFQHLRLSTRCETR